LVTYLFFFTTQQHYSTMNTAKLLISKGILTALPYEAGPLLRVIASESLLCNHKRLICPISSLKKVIFEYDKDIFPFFRLYDEKDVVGYAHLFENGVGRVMLLTKTSEKFTSSIQQMCCPCLCKAGHLLVLRFRVSETQIKCTCESSTLKCLEKSCEIEGKCPITQEKEIPFRIYQNHALSSIDQRARISGPR
jgi:hypothetical protein